MFSIDNTLKDSLKSLGFTAETYRVLMLLPLVYVAWADGHMDDAEIERIDEIAKTRFHLGPTGLSILDGWLFERPTREYFNEGMKDLFYLAQAEDGEPLVHPEELHDLLVHCESIARASGHALERPHGRDERRRRRPGGNRPHAWRGQWRQLGPPARRARRGAGLGGGRAGAELAPPGIVPRQLAARRARTV